MSIRRRDAIPLILAAPLLAPGTAKAANTVVEGRSIRYMQE